MSDDTTDELDVDAQKERLYNEYGKPAKRDEPLDLEVDNLVFVCTAGGGFYDIELARVMKTDVTHSEVDRKMVDGSFDGDENTTYVDVRYGTTMHDSTYVPETYVLEVVAEKAKWDTDKHQYVKGAADAGR